MSKNYLTIRQASQRLGICESTIRMYCRKGLVKPKRDKARNWRWFTEEDVKKISNIINPR